MIRPWVKVLASFHATPIFARMWMGVAAMTAYAAAITATDLILLPNQHLIGASLHGVLGVVLGMLLVFRTNTSYDRWWEGRKLWGQLVNESRNLAIKVQTIAQAATNQKQDFGRLVIAFALALKGHLRNGVKLRELPSFQNETHEPPHVPVELAQRIYALLAAWRRDNLIDGFEFLLLDQQAASLMNICGACERIQKSPISASYRWFIRQMIGIYLLTLPFGLIEGFGWWTIAAVALLSYFMIGVEMIAEEIEDPFGDSEDDLRLDALCQTIENSVRTVLELPGFPAP